MDSLARKEIAELRKRVETLEAEKVALEGITKEYFRVRNLLGRMRADFRLLPEFEKRIPRIGELPLVLASLVKDPKLGEAIEADREELGLRPGRDW